MEELITVEVTEVKVATNAALLVVVEGEEHWLPRSASDDAAAWEEGDEGTIEVAAWWARKEGIVE